MKKSLEIVEQLKRYFNAQVIGSQLFVDAGLLPESSTNDIDIAVVEKSDSTNSVKTFLEDQGFSGEELYVFDNDRYKNVLSRVKYKHPEYDKVIDLNYFSKTQMIYTIPELVQAKFSQGRKQDLEQLIEVILKKGGTDLQELSDLYTQYKQ